MRGCEEVVPLLGPLHDGALADDDRAWVEVQAGTRKRRVCVRT